jgi:hypothetical protein
MFYDNPLIIWTKIQILKIIIDYNFVFNENSSEV